jgi:dihydropteroate synthase
MYIGNKFFDFSQKAYIMGILNVTPDSFSDGGNYTTLDAALQQALTMEREGAHIIDIGGESTRPGHSSLSVEEEIARVLPIIEALVPALNIPLSIDTSKSKVAEAAIKAGAQLINDVWGFKSDPILATIASRYNVPCCLMHNRKEKIPSALVNSTSQLLEIMRADLQESLNIALKAGIKSDQIILDPGIGFAKSLEDNLLIMNSLEKFSTLGFPLLLGTSRKSMIGLTLDLPVDQRLEGTIATTVLGYMKGCRIFRVHDVKENLRALRMVEAICQSTH